MARIPTTQRDYYNTQTKVNTLGAVAGSLLPAAQDYQRLRLNQEQIKIDTNATKARMEMDGIVNQWRLNNQADPDNEEAKMSLQQNLQSVLDKYGSQIAPIAKMDWDVTANEMMSGYQMAHNDWAFTQRAENTKLNVAENINLNLDMAYRDGLNGNVLGGYANLDNSYRQLMTYAMPNLGEQGARELLTDYKSDYTTSFVSGLIERDPQAAIDFLSDEGNQKALNNDRKFGALRSLAQKGMKTAQELRIQQFNRDKKENYISFLENPTLDNLDYYVTTYEPEMSDTKYKTLATFAEKMNPKAKTKTLTLYDVQMRELGFQNTDTPEGQQELLDKGASIMEKAIEDNKAGKLSANDAALIKKAVVSIIKNPEIKNQAKDMLSGEDFIRIANKAGVSVLQLPQALPQITDSVAVVDNTFVPAEKPRITSVDQLTRKVKFTEEELEAREASEPEPVIYESEREAEEAIEALKNMPLDTEEQKTAFLEQAQIIYAGIVLGEQKGFHEEGKDLTSDLSEVVGERIFSSLDNMPQSGYWEGFKQSVKDTYESLQAPDDLKKKRAEMIESADGAGLLLSGFWEVWKGATGAWNSLKSLHKTFQIKNKIDEIQQNAGRQTMVALMKGDKELADKIKKDAREQAIRVQYYDIPDLQNKDLKEGDLVTINGVPYRFAGYTSEDIMLEAQ